MFCEVNSLVIDRVDVIPLLPFCQSKLILHVLGYRYVLIFPNRFFCGVPPLIQESYDSPYQYLVYREPLPHPQASFVHQHEKLYHTGCSPWTSIEARHIKHVQ